MSVWNRGVYFHDDGKVDCECRVPSASNHIVFRCSGFWFEKRWWGNILLSIRLFEWTVFNWNCKTFDLSCEKQQLIIIIIQVDKSKWHCVTPLRPLNRKEQPEVSLTIRDQIRHPPTPMSSMEHLFLVAMVVVALVTVVFVHYSFNCILRHTHILD